jgi:hypothetical protein
MSAITRAQSNTTKSRSHFQSEPDPQLVFISHDTGSLNAEDRKIIRRRLLTLNRRKKASNTQQSQGDSTRNSLRTSTVSGEVGLGCGKGINRAGTRTAGVSTSQHAHESLVIHRAEHPLLAMNRLGNIITDPFGILEEVACPDIPTYDAFCH